MTASACVPRSASGSALRLIDADYDVAVWSRTAAHADELVARGATRAGAPGDVVATGHLFSMLASEGVLRAVLPAGLLRGSAWLRSCQPRHDQLPGG